MTDDILPSSSNERFSSKNSEDVRILLVGDGIYFIIIFLLYFL